MYTNISEQSSNFRLEIRDLAHRYSEAQNNPLRDINLQVQDGHIHFLLGPSGSGKTTLLRLIAGLETLQHGDIRINGVCSRGLAPDKRGVGLVFQDHALFPNLTARANIAFGLRARGIRQKLSHREKIDLEAMVLRFGLDAVADQYPYQLSGGQQQRVGIARAVIGKPAVVLFDEPFSSLDGRTKEHVRDDILHLLNATRSSALIVSHDPQDAMHMADHITLLNAEGEIAQDGTPEEIFYQPKSVFVAQFMSEVNTFSGVFQAGSFHTPFGVFPSAHFVSEEQKGVMTVRPEGLHLLPSDTRELRPGFAQVVASRLAGASSVIHLRAFDADGADIHIHAKQQGVYLPKAGTVHRIIIDPRMSNIFPKDEYKHK